MSKVEYIEVNKFRMTGNPTAFSMSRFIERFEIKQGENPRSVSETFAETKNGHSRNIVRRKNPDGSLVVSISSKHPQVVVGDTVFMAYMSVPNMRVREVVKQEVNEKNGWLVAEVVCEEIVLN